MIAPLKFHKTCLFYKPRDSTQGWCHKFNCLVICDDIEPESYRCWVRLSDRQLEILRLMPNHAYEEIALKLGITPSTVKNIQKRIYQKFELLGGKERGETRLKAVLWGIELGLIDLSEVRFCRIRKSGEVCGCDCTFVRPR